MAVRWRVLGVLFLVRTAMAFQFQASAALAPFAMEYYGVGLAETGLIFGLYFAPGIVMALPAGAMGAWLGDARLVRWGLWLMCAGAVIMALAPEWNTHMAGRLLAGVGGITLNLFMSKIVADTFDGHEVGTAMSVFIASWPAGIALALSVLPRVAESHGFTTGLWVTVTIVLLGLLCFVLSGAGSKATAVSAPGQIWPRGRIRAATLAAGTLWGLYNAALAMVFAFGALILVERGWSLAPASDAAGSALWALALTTPLGGILADRTGRNDAVILVGLVAFFALMTAASLGWLPGILFPITGLVGGLAAGPIMTLPARVLPVETRATGLGLFFAIYYLLIVTGPIIGGFVAELAGTTLATFWLAAAMLAICVLILGLYRFWSSDQSGSMSPSARSS
ncbi:MAG: MFS transporter [Pseudomonadota bacterium]